MTISKKKSRRAKSKWKQALAKVLRDHPTPEEALMRLAMEKLGFSFQQIVLGYIPDFAHFKRRVIVEIDGAPHFTLEGRAGDMFKDEVFRSHGWKVVRIENSLVRKNPEAVLALVTA